MQIPAVLRPWRHNLKATEGGDEQERETPFLPFLPGIGEIILVIEKKLSRKGDGKSICWNIFFHHQSPRLRKSGKRKEKNQIVRVALISRNHFFPRGTKTSIFFLINTIAIYLF